MDKAGHIYIADFENHRIRKIISPTGVITTVAGGSYGFSGDGGPATGAQLSNPFGVAVDQAGYLYIADGPNSRIRKVISPTGIITTVVGTTPGFSGDDGRRQKPKLIYRSPLRWINGVIFILPIMATNAFVR